MIDYHRRSIASHEKSLATHQAHLDKLLAKTLHAHTTSAESQCSSSENGGGESTPPSDVNDSVAGPGQGPTQA
jgi:hypothetical protein